MSSAIQFASVMLVALLAGSPPGFDEAEYVGRWVSMWNTYDLDRVDDLFVADSRVTYYSSEKEGLVQGIDQVREHHRGFGFVSGGRPPERELWVEDVRSDDFGDTVVVTAIWYFGDRSSRDEAQRGPMTILYVRVGDDYRIAHMHFASY